MRDSQRAKVYAAEQSVRTLFDRAAERGSRAVEFFGAHLTLPPEGTFGSVDAVQRYVDDVLALPSVRDRWRDVAPLRVRARRAATAAHYEIRSGEIRSGEIRSGENRSGSGVIAIPDHDTADWALRELVVLHEVAHHLCPAGPAHGPDFVATMCELTGLVMGPEVGHVLRVVFAREDVR